jgi:four helix bundle protein
VKEQEDGETGKRDLRQRCFKFSLAIIAFSDGLPNKRSTWIINDQLIRSCTSIGANITEAKASGSRLEFKRYFEIALKSANESKYWLELLRDSNAIEKTAVNNLINEVTELANMLERVFSN